MPSAKDLTASTHSRWQLFRDSHFWHSFKKEKVAIVCFIIFISYVLVSLFAPLIAPTDPYDMTQFNLMDSELPPAWEEEGDERFLLGTDAQGRDMWSTILYGTRLSMIIGLCAVLLQAFLGIVVGLAAGYFGVKIDSFLMRLADIQLSFSTLMVAIIFLAIFQAAFGAELYQDLAMTMLIIVIGIAEWPQYARTIRASVLAERKNNM